MKSGHDKHSNRLLSRNPTSSRPQESTATLDPRLKVYLSLSPLSLSLSLSLSPSAILCLALSVSQYTTLRCLWLVKDYCYHQPGRYANRTGSPPPLVTSPALSTQRVSCNCRPTGSAATSRFPPPSFAPSFLACCCFLVSVSVSLFHRF